jgi:hypothetical protein
VKGARLDRSPCDSDRAITRTWPQIVYEKLFFPLAIQRLDQEKHLLLWHCQTQQDRHATGLRSKENETQKEAQFT